MKAWTEAEEDFVYKNQEISSKLIADRLGRTELSISNKKYRLSHPKIRESKRGDREDRKLDFLVSLLIVKNRNVKHKNVASGCMEAVRAGCLENIKIKVV